LKTEKRLSWDEGSENIVDLERHESGSGDIYLSHCRTEGLLQIAMANTTLDNILLRSFKSFCLAVVERLANPSS